MEGKNLKDTLQSSDFLASKNLDTTSAQNKELLDLTKSQYNAIKLKNLVKNDFINFDNIAEMYPVWLRYSAVKFAKNYQGFINSMLKVNSKLAICYQSMKARCLNLNKIENKIAVSKAEILKQNTNNENIKNEVKSTNSSSITYVFNKYSDILTADLPNVYEKFNSNQDKYIGFVTSFQSVANTIKENSKVRVEEQEISYSMQ